MQLLLWLPKPKHFEPLDDFLDHFENLEGQDRSSPFYLKGMALGYLHAPKKRDVKRAMEFARCAAEVTGWKGPGILSTLAMARFEAKQVKEAILTLEFPPGSLRQHSLLDSQLEEYRESFFPNLASEASIDWALERQGRAVGPRRQLGIDHRRSGQPSMGKN